MDVTIKRKGLLDSFTPISQESTNYKQWKAIIDFKICESCYARHGKVYSMAETPDIEPPIHSNCRCHISPLSAIVAGNATNNGEDGADWHLKYFGSLPEYYITATELEALGWRSGKNPSKYAPGKMFTAGVYFNDDGHLPQKIGRIWYEADINYTPGRRNRHRIVWSNDGLIFVTYDHYVTFYEVI